MFKINELLKATGGKLICGNIKDIVKGVSIDTRTIKPNEAFLAIKGLNFDGHDFIDEAIKKGSKVIITQSSKLQAPNSNKANFILVKDTTKALGDIARHQRRKFNIPVIAITGSSGKTTTKDMLAWVLSKRFKVLKNEGTKNNHIGVPLTLLKLNSSHELAVIEAGTNHPGEIGYLAAMSEPNIGIITNIGSSHLEHFKNTRGVFKEKSILLKNLLSPGIAVLNADDLLLRPELMRVPRGRVSLGVGIKNNSDFVASGIKKVPGGIEFKVNKGFKFKLKTLGYYNIYNALAVIACCRVMGLSYRDIALRMACFDFPKDRLELLSVNHVKFINDTYNSNPVSLRQALDALDNFSAKGRKILVMGDMLELGNRKELFHNEAGREAAKVCDVILSVGGLSKLAAQAAAVSGFDPRNIFSCASNPQARDILFKEISPGPDDIVLVKGSRGMKMEEIFKQE